jgi:hypothetical protein
MPKLNNEINQVLNVLEYSLSIIFLAFRRENIVYLFFISSSRFEKFDNHTNSVYTLSKYLLIFSLLHIASESEIIEPNYTKNLALFLFSL